MLALQESMQPRFICGNAARDCNRAELMQAIQQSLTGMGQRHGSKAPRAPLVVGAAGARGAACKKLSAWTCMVSVQLRLAGRICVDGAAASGQQLLLPATVAANQGLTQGAAARRERRLRQMPAAMACRKSIEGRWCGSCHASHTAWEDRKRGAAAAATAAARPPAPPPAASSHCPRLAIVHGSPARSAPDSHSAHLPAREAGSSASFHSPGRTSDRLGIALSRLPVVLVGGGARGWGRHGGWEAVEASAELEGLQLADEGRSE